MYGSSIIYDIQSLADKTQRGFDTIANGLEQLEIEVNKVKQAIDYSDDQYPSCAIQNIRKEITWIYNALDQMAHEQSNNLAKKRRKVTIRAYGKIIEVSRK